MQNTTQATNTSTMTTTLTMTNTGKAIVALPGYMRFEYGADLEILPGEKRIGRGGTANIRFGHLLNPDAIKLNGDSELVAVKEYFPSKWQVTLTQIIRSRGRIGEGRLSTQLSL